MALRKRTPRDPAQPRLRGEAAAEVLRAQLTPYAPGERPVPILIACFVAGALAAANLIPVLLGKKLHGYPPSSALIFAAVMISAAVGMWRLRYWAVLGFEALLAIAVLIFALLLTIASNIEGLLLCLAIVGCGGWLFWKLVRVMARIQLPTRQPPVSEDSP